MLHAEAIAMHIHTDINLHVTTLRTCADDTYIRERGGVAASPVFGSATNRLGNERTGMSEIAYA